ncbi:Myomegalin [Galemys pyrenaicus]|uniref:Myomegalin n=1 Tax=Galemys pyrenaicus TaxID=202257 RepID=A0A8J6DR35_GALPY|nr:Myomegalin [Galemys pyrenaicus]
MCRNTGKANEKRSSSCRAGSAGRRQLHTQPGAAWEPSAAPSGSAGGKPGHYLDTFLFHQEASSWENTPLETGMQQSSENKGAAEKGGNEPKTRSEEAGVSSVSHTRNCRSLIQDQARELTHLQQKMRIGKAVSSHLMQHVKNTVKNFEELLNSSKIDHYLEQHFREQLAKGSQLAESLASKFSTGILAGIGDLQPSRGRAHRRPHPQATVHVLWDLQKKKKATEVREPRPDARPQISSSSLAQPARPPTSWLPAEQEAPPVGVGANAGPATPADSASLSSSHSGPTLAQPVHRWSDAAQLSRTQETGHLRSSELWGETRPQKMNASGDLASFSSLYRPSSKPSGADLLEKNLVEIQNLRQRLEESVCINDRLRERLELVLGDADPGKGRRGPELRPLGTPGHLRPQQDRDRQL